MYHASYSGLPSFVAGPARDLLVSQGFPSDSIDGDGNFNPAAILSGVVSEVEIRTNFSPRIVLDVGQIARSQGQAPSFVTKTLMGALRPTVVLRGRANATIAPYGEAGPGGWLGLVGVVGGLIAFGWWLGRS
jgi:hypothetical protein